MGKAKCCNCCCREVKKVYITNIKIKPLGGKRKGGINVRSKSAGPSGKGPALKSSKSDQHILSRVKEICAPFLLSDDEEKKICDRFLQQVKLGLSRRGNAEATIKCYLTFVQDLPTGTEKGRFLALDLGGSNLRILMIHLTGDVNFETKSHSYELPQSVMVGPGDKLFDHIAEAMAKFIKSENLIDEELPLAFTFSFPCRQTSLRQGYLIKWTKGFNSSGVVGEDVGKLLKEAIDRRGDIKVDVMGILNDTTGTLLSCAWRARDCKVGLICGTGSNICYVEQVANVDKFENPEPGKPEVLINCEWGAFGEKNEIDFITTEYDREVDEKSLNRGQQLFEKMIGGMYLGELARLILLKLAKNGVLFEGLPIDGLEVRDKLQTEHISLIESEDPGEHTVCRVILKGMNLSPVTDRDCANVRYVCECVVKRAAALVSCGVATILNKMNRPDCTVGIDGSVYRLHPYFHCLMIQKIRKLINKNLKFNLMVSEDGSGRGAAIVAAISQRTPPPE